MNLFFWKRKVNPRDELRCSLITIDTRALSESFGLVLSDNKTRLQLCEEVAVLRRQIFPNRHTARYWIEAKFPPLEYSNEEQLQQLIDCLTSKRDQYTCPIHGRQHAPTRRSVDRSP